MIGKVLLHAGNNQSKSKTLTNKFGFLQIQLRGLGAQPQGQFCNLYPHLCLETVFLVLELAQNCCENVAI